MFVFILVKSTNLWRWSQTDSMPERSYIEMLCLQSENSSHHLSQVLAGNAFLIHCALHVCYMLFSQPCLLSITLHPNYHTTSNTGWELTMVLDGYN